MMTVTNTPKQTDDDRKTIIQMTVIFLQSHVKCIIPYEKSTLYVF